ncbi:MAG: hypothetical protein Ct9H300mP1_09720 [Planctomycetaceae bacterium]|nr:MAG: hypothetical protein Ct9H300mP1_09720 [Planctomycetaceae bacterium]
MARPSSGTSRVLAFHVASSRPKVALRDGDWKLLAHLGDPQIKPFGDIRAKDQQAIKTQKITRLELYNLAEDVGETRDRGTATRTGSSKWVPSPKACSGRCREETPTWRPGPGRDTKENGCLGREVAGFRLANQRHRQPSRRRRTDSLESQGEHCLGHSAAHRSNSLPVFTRRSVFTCVEPFGLAKLDLADGKVLWQRTSSYTDITSPGDWTTILKEVKQLKTITDEQTSLRKQREKLEDQLDKAKDKDALLAKIEKIEAREESLQEKADGMPRAARYTRADHPATVQRLHHCDADHRRSPGLDRLRQPGRDLL